MRERLQKIEVTNRNVVNIIREHKHEENTFIYLDVPYLHSLRGKNADRVYKTEMPLNIQIQILHELQQCKCKVMLCGYRETEDYKLYDTYLLPYGYYVWKMATVRKIAQSKGVKDEVDEYIWTNYRINQQGIEEVYPKRAIA